MKAPSSNIFGQPRRSRSLAHDVVIDIGEKIRNGIYEPGSKLPTEVEIMRHYGVSRTVVREAISRLQAAGIAQTRHGVGTFILGNRESIGFKVDPDALAMIRELMAVLEMRASLEREAAGFAAMRRTEQDLQAMRQTLDQFWLSIEEGGDTVELDVQFHKQIAMAAANHYFSDVLDHLGNMVMPRARVDSGTLIRDTSAEYLRKICGEHETIYDAILRQDERMARAAMHLHLGNSLQRLRKSHHVAGLPDENATFP